MSGMPKHEGLKGTITDAHYNSNYNSMTAIEKSNKMLQDLEVVLSKAIMKFEQDNNYQLKSYEVDLLLLKKLTENQMRYRKDKFGS